MRIFSGLIGLICLFIGVLALVFNTDLPESVRPSVETSFAVLVVGGVLAYLGREYLGMWLAYLLSGGGD